MSTRTNENNEVVGECLQKNMAAVNFKGLQVQRKRYCAQEVVRVQPSKIEGGVQMKKNWLIRWA